MSASTHRIFVVVANASHAKLFRRANHASPLEAVRDLQHDASRAPSRELVTDRPGRTEGQARVHQASLGEDVTPHEREKAVFARLLAAELDRDDGEFDELVVVAPPHFLGALRAAMAPRTAKKVVDEIGHDFTSVAQRTLVARFGAAS